MSLYTHMYLFTIRFINRNEHLSHCVASSITFYTGAYLVFELVTGPPTLPLYVPFPIIYSLTYLIWTNLFIFRYGTYRFRKPHWPVRLTWPHACHLCQGTDWVTCGWTRWAGGTITGCGSMVCVFVCVFVFVSVCMCVYVCVCVCVCRCGWADGITTDYGSMVGVCGCVWEIYRDRESVLTRWGHGTTTLSSMCGVWERKTEK